MAFSKDDLNRVTNELKRYRDELKLKVHLAKADARDEWNELEKRWERFEEQAEERFDELEDTAEEQLDKLEDTLERTAADLRERYRRLRDRL